MRITKSENHNAIITQLHNVRPHPNADKIKLATVLNTQVVVSLEAKNDDVIVYFSSDLILSADYLTNNNLYSNPELNMDKTTKGYFATNGRVKAQKFRGEVSNGYVAELKSLWFGSQQNFDWQTLVSTMTPGIEFTHINDVEICRKYIVPSNLPGQPGSRNRTRKRRQPASVMFKQHWDTKQFMREYETIPSGNIVYIEEKIHGTSGRTGKALCSTNRKRYQIWKPKEEWKVLSGTRRVDTIYGHMREERREIEDKLAPHLHKGETVYYEIFGHQKNGKEIQSKFSYGCIGGEYKVMLYRVTVTTPDGFTIDFPREMVYRRADELEMMKPIKLLEGMFLHNELINEVQKLVHGNSAIANHMKEGVVVWYQNADGTWNALKYKSEEFLCLESKQRDENIDDVENGL